MMIESFFDRDLSWLSFNERVLNEAGNKEVPVVERIRFLSIYSSNLDEFYRVRMPALMNTSGSKSHNGEDAFHVAGNVVQRQQHLFGKILREQLLPVLKQNKIHLVYDEQVPANIGDEIKTWFFANIAAFLQVVDISSGNRSFFSENNKLYQVVLTVDTNGKECLFLVTVPSDQLPRFFTLEKEGTQYIVFIDDITREMVPGIFPGHKISGIFNIKITRDAALDLQDEFAGDLAEKIEIKIATRDRGYATRFLYEPGIPLRVLYWLSDSLQLLKTNMVRGGKYHNLVDLNTIPVHDKKLYYPGWPALVNDLDKTDSLFEAIITKDRLVHTPYQSYNTVLRFFNEAAINPDVAEIYVTLYRVAANSRIAGALITAAKNGKKVTVFVELKARFDEANNIRWSKTMKAAGVKIIYSIPNLKVHAKVALVKLRKGDRMVSLGLLSTGNLNETTARFYTDHILLTAQKPIVQELEMLFIFLVQKRKPVSRDEIAFRHLLVAQFNLQDAFLNLIEREIKNAQAGLPAGVIIKLNNLEEKVMIRKLYEASNAGVKVDLIIRSICCLKPGIPGMSENITVRRIVDRYLEHGRIFIFNNNNDQQVYLGSADWMNRNIYSRIEVCFPLYDIDLKEQILKIMHVQLADNTSAVYINELLQNVPIDNAGASIRSQQNIYQLLSEGIVAEETATT